ncbi:glucose-6-phosphate dehydrogenase [Roseibacterium sp. SDUM158017]|uniref:glucose-6-phosphate dehydrogenase n=1 Tax=Roseicyclus salinarum TaxID=3036773 RepID=UPI0024157E90|nr:glucose-6-phosphate dehydrogenase [Roseibacterium sp. SDUM158017]MDG4647641.1 glucose-6-phosphate dehydrogenase [Roseibacterium sp. SDUM158017]
MVSRVIPVDPFDLVVFGGTGDLARRKILPALYRRFCDGQMPREARIIGAARTQQPAEAWRAWVGEALEEFVPAGRREEGATRAFLERLDYLAVDAKGDGGWNELRERMRPEAVQAFYFSVAPGLFGDLAERLHRFDIARPDARIVVEKPFGNDLASARALNRTLSEVFDETQIYRIDHYLGKETVQNLMAVRFGNVLFEPLWNTQYIDHVQITVAEQVGVSGRGAYYDQSGAMRDMMQNHLMQLLCLTAMEPPSRFEPDAVRDEKLKVIRALDPVEPGDIVRGQYRGGPYVPSYAEDAENPDSRTESFIAMKLHIANWRWNGTPFYLRTGKRLRARKSEIVIHFKEPPHSIFDEDAGSRHNVLSIRLQPDEGIDLRVTIKEPGPGGMRLIDVPLDMSFADALGAESADVPDAYERLIMDVIRGNQTLFMRGDEVEAAWAWADPIIEGWTRRGDRPFAYEAGSSGPEEALMLLHRDGRRWREISA